MSTARDAPGVRPRTRGDCVDGPRPCPWASCRHHLLIDAQQHRPGLTLEQLKQSCALDVADEGGATLEQVAAMFGITRSRIRQIEQEALGRARSGRRRMTRELRVLGEFA